MAISKKTLSGYQTPDSPRAKYPSNIPPSRKDDCLRPSRPPRGIRTPDLGVQSPGCTPRLPEKAPSWMKRAQRMAAALNTAISKGSANANQLAALERAWSAYELGGVSDEDIARVSHLCERAHSAIRSHSRGNLEKASRGCAQVLMSGLPRSAKRQIDLDELQELVNKMRHEADPWAAVVDTTSQIIGWNVRARTHAAHAIRIAIDSSKRSL